MVPKFRDLSLASSSISSGQGMKVSVARKFSVSSRLSLIEHFLYVRVSILRRTVSQVSAKVIKTLRLTCARNLLPDLPSSSKRVVREIENLFGVAAKHPP
jgi:hypothetical protein